MSLRKPLDIKNWVVFSPTRGVGVAKENPTVSR